MGWYGRSVGVVEEKVAMGDEEGIVQYKYSTVQRRYGAAVSKAGPATECPGRYGIKSLDESSGSGECTVGGNGSSGSSAHQVQLWYGVVYGYGSE